MPWMHVYGRKRLAVGACKWGSLLTCKKIASKIGLKVSLGRQRILQQSTKVRIVLRVGGAHREPRLVTPVGSHGHSAFPAVATGLQIGPIIIHHHCNAVRTWHGEAEGHFSWWICHQTAVGVETEDAFSGRVKVASATAPMRELLWKGHYLPTQPVGGFAGLDEVVVHSWQGVISVTLG